MKAFLKITLAAAALFVSTQAHAASCKEELFKLYDDAGTPVRTISRVELTEKTITYRVETGKSIEKATMDLETCEMLRRELVK